MSSNARHTLKLDANGHVVGRVGLDKPAGHYKVADRVSFETANRPNWLHRTMAKLLLGWRWMPRA